MTLDLNWIVVIFGVYLMLHGLFNGDPVAGGIGLLVLRAGIEDLHKYK